MIRKTAKITAGLTCVIISICVLRNHCAAEQGQAVFEVKAPFEPTSASTIIFSSQGSREEKPSELNATAPNTYQLSLQYDTNTIGQQTYSAAMLISETGEASFSNVSRLDTQYPMFPASTVPACEDSVVTRSKPDSLSIYESLVKVRMDRRNNLKLELKSLLQGELVERLKQSEQVLGLARDEDLNADLDPVELVDRLSRILFSIQQYRIQKERTKGSSAPQ